MESKEYVAIKLLEIYYKYTASIVFVTTDSICEKYQEILHKLELENELYNDTK